MRIAGNPIVDDHCGPRSHVEKAETVRALWIENFLTENLQERFGEQSNNAHCTKQPTITNAALKYIAGLESVDEHVRLLRKLAPRNSREISVPD